MNLVQLKKLAETIQAVDYGCESNSMSVLNEWTYRSDCHSARSLCLAYINELTDAEFYCLSNEMYKDQIDDKQIALGLEYKALVDAFNRAFNDEQLFCDVPNIVGDMEHIEREIKEHRAQHGDIVNDDTSNEYMHTHTHDIEDTPLLTTSLGGQAMNKLMIKAFAYNTAVLLLLMVADILIYGDIGVQYMQYTMCALLVVGATYLLVRNGVRIRYAYIIGACACALIGIGAACSMGIGNVLLIGLTNAAICIAMLPVSKRVVLGTLKSELV